MISAQAILVVAIVDCDFDRNRRIDQSDQSSGDADEVCVSAVGCTSKAKQGKVSIWACTAA